MPLSKVNLPKCKDLVVAGWLAVMAASASASGYNSSWRGGKHMSHVALHCRMLRWAVGRLTPQSLLDCTNNIYYAMLYLN